MQLKDFRELTKDLPDNAFIYVLSEGVWKSPSSCRTRAESLVFVEGQEVPETLKNQVEIRLELPK